MLPNIDYLYLEYRSIGLTKILSTISILEPLFGFQIFSCLTIHFYFGFLCYKNWTLNAHYEYILFKEKMIIFFYAVNNLLLNFFRSNTVMIY